ncbi:DUF5798 family protein [Halobacteriaceae archaeon GCM10025711]
MGLGSTAKKLEKMVDLADKLYNKVNELLEKLQETKQSVENTNERVGAIEADLADHRKLLEALAEDQGLDVDELLDDESSETATASVGDGGDA